MALNDVLYLKGSPSRDHYKHLRKRFVGKTCWGLDADFMMVEKIPLPFIVAVLDFKMPYDGVTFAEAVAYQHFQREGIPVFLLTGPRGILEADPAEHRFKVEKIVRLDHRPEPPTVDVVLVLDGATWDDLAKWELELREIRKIEMRLNGNGHAQHSPATTGAHP